MGALLGFLVGPTVGACDTVGPSVGLLEGEAVGSPVGDGVGSPVGFLEGEDVGAFVGEAEGAIVGWGEMVTSAEGAADGNDTILAEAPVMGRPVCAAMAAVPPPIARNKFTPFTTSAGSTKSSEFTRGTDWVASMRNSNLSPGPRESAQNPTH